MTHKLTGESSRSQLREGDARRNLSAFMCLGDGTKIFQEDTQIDDLRQ